MSPMSLVCDHCCIRKNPEMCDNSENDLCSYHGSVTHLETYYETYNLKSYGMNVCTYFFVRCSLIVIQT